MIGKQSILPSTYLQIELGLSSVYKARTDNIVRSRFDSFTTSRISTALVCIIAVATSMSLHWVSSFPAPADDRGKPVGRPREEASTTQWQSVTMAGYVPNGVTGQPMLRI